ncbi:UNVERIFIED_CONTAM: hypothetical protein Slati_2756900 [Sesamum latifolium]|uniref:Uncharacterized protein n=1 Tax=Sesamum latifolium TaxID=2727402 RepID=A0AAW2VZ50_9LAMI
MPLWLDNEIWLQLQAYWANQDFQQESSKNKANLAANPTASSTVYRGGSSSVGMHKRKSEAELDRPPKQMELFERCYKKKEDGGWSGPRAAKVVETFQKLMEEHQPTADEGHSPAESEALISDLHFTIATATATLEEMMADMMVMMRANSSTAAPSQPTASSAAPVPPPQPPTDPEPPNNDEMEGLD